MATTAAVRPLRTNDRVVARTALRGVPEGTPGKVIHVQGLTWTRYWVWFDNGQRVGTIDRAKLATADEWATRFDAPAGALAVVGGGGAAAAGSGDAAGGAKGKYGVPELLLERSKRARERLAAK